MSSDTSAETAQSRSTLRRRRAGRCPYCREEFATGESCTTATIPFPDGSSVPAVRFGQETDQFAPRGPRCPDCGVRRGGVHHPFCEIERCPRCHGRLMTCRCLDRDVTIHR